MKSAPSLQGLYASRIPNAGEPWTNFVEGTAVGPERAQIVRVGQASLSSLIRTCQRLRSVAQPILYDSPAVVAADHDDSAACARLSCLIRTLAERPVLSRRTTQIEASCSAASIQHGTLLGALLQTSPNFTTVHPSLPSPLLAEKPSALGVVTPAFLCTLRLSAHDHRGLLNLACAFFSAWRLVEFTLFDLYGCVRVVWGARPRNHLTPPPVLAVPFSSLRTLRLSQAKMDLVSFQALLRSVGPGLSDVAVCMPDVTGDDIGAELDAVVANNFTEALPVNGVLRALMPWARALRTFAYTVKDHLPLAL